MALKTVYDNTNKVTETGLSVTYRQEYNSDGYWEITRFAKKSYKFIGMDEETAYACAAAKRSQYTRSFSRLQGSGDTLQSVTVTECPSDIAPQHVEGDVWEVSIAVNEQDVKYSASAVANPSSLFTTANARNYDEDAGQTVISLDSATRSGTSLTFTYSEDISEFNDAALVCQYKLDESDASWTTAARTGSSPSPVSVPDQTVYVRLVYGSLESNTLTAE